MISKYKVSALSLLSIVGSFVSCGVQKEKAADPRKSGDEISAQSSPETQNLQTQIPEQPKAFQSPSGLLRLIPVDTFDGGLEAEIRVLWEEIADEQVWLFRHAFGKTEEVAVLRREDQHRRPLIESNLKSGVKYTYFIVHSRDSHVRDPQHTATMLMPLRLSLETGQKISLREITARYPDAVTQKTDHKVIHFGRMVMNANSVLFSEGENWKIRIDNLQVRGKGAEITSFPAGTTAPAQRDGRSSGQIVLEVATVSGEALMLFSRGERGGKGVDGKNGSNGSNGNAGKDAVVVQISHFGSSRPVCARRASWGSTAKAGERGQDGGTGYRGGDALPFGVRFLGNGSKAFAFRAESGAGGDGGSAGRGGSGGTRVVGKTIKPCKKPGKPKNIRAAGGANGSNGRSGQGGRVKADGLCYANGAGHFLVRCLGGEVLW